MLYDFSKTGFSEISWAAFYGDCEHEVLEVASGHRLTLTYNLYISEQMGGVVQKFPSANPTMYSVYEKLKSLLQDPNFLRQGTPHASNSPVDYFPWAHSDIFNC